MNIKQGVIFLFILIVQASCSSYDFPDTGYVREVTQGDLLVVPSNFIDDNSGDRHFKLYGITCYDPQDQDIVRAYFGVLAKEFVEDLVDEKEVAIHYPVATNEGEVNLNIGWIEDVASKQMLHEMILISGLGRFDETVVLDDDVKRKLQLIEQEAKESHLGLWALKVPDRSEMQRVVNDAKTPWGRVLRSFTNPKFPEARHNPLLGQVSQSTVTCQNKSQELDHKQPVQKSMTTQRETSQLTQKKKEGKPSYSWNYPTPFEKQVTSSGSSDQTPEFSQEVYQDIARLLATINQEAHQARNVYLKWLAMPEENRMRQVQQVRQHLRKVKIHVMDVLDSDLNLTAAQKGYLGSLKDDMNRLMKFVGQ